MIEAPYWLQALRRRVDRGWFNWRCRGILDTAPVRCDSRSPLVIVSQLYSPDVTMYLLAAKSLCRWVAPREFHIVDDGLSAQDRQVLQRHLGSVVFTTTGDVRVEGTPRGGCWERLLTLADRNEDSYVVQLDSDTLTVSDPVEVRKCIARGRTFTLGTPTGRHLVSAAEATAYADQHVYDHVQSHTERALARMPNAATLKYVRGCAGFTGFARGDLRRSAIEDFARDMSALVGAERFAQWGSEQVASNLMAANAPDALVLPVDTYPFWKPGLDTTRLALIHFFGTYRFLGGMYLRQSLKVIDALRGAGPQEVPA